MAIPSINHELFSASRKLECGFVFGDGDALHLNGEVVDTIRLQVQSRRISATENRSEVLGAEVCLPYTEKRMQMYRE
jgi:hypothetical protein